MGRFDSYFDPDQFQDSGGLLGRLLSLQGQQGPYQPGASFDPQSAASGQTASEPQTPVPLPVASSAPPSVAQTPHVAPTPDYGQTQNIAIGNYQMPQFGRVDGSQGVPSPDLGERLSAGFRSWAHTPVGNPFAAIANGITGFNAGQRADAAGVVPGQTPSPTSTPSPDLGDRLSAGVQSFAHTPVGNPFVALANGIAALSSGQRTDAAGAVPAQALTISAPSPDFGDRLSAGLQSWAHTPVGNPFTGLAGSSTGQRTDPVAAQQSAQPGASVSANAHQGLNAQYQALRPLLGDRNAMLAIVHPEVGQSLMAQALAGQTVPGTAIKASPPRNGRSGTDDQTSSIPASQSPSLTRVGYVEIPANPNQAFGELWGIQASREKDTVSGTDFASGVREGNIKHNDDGSLDVTNGTVITFSLVDNHAKLITVTGEDIAHIDPETGRVVIQKSP